MKDIVEIILEIPYRSRNKYEIDSVTGRIKLDRVLYSAMGYPAEYGSVENTLAEDGDPLDILVFTSEPTYPGCIIPARIIGCLEMIDNNKLDYKLIAVSACDPRYNEVGSLKDIATFTLKEIKNFFENYKKLQNIKVVVKDYRDKEYALKVLEESKKRYIEKNS